MSILPVLVAATVIASHPARPAATAAVTAPSRSEWAITIAALAGGLAIDRWAEPANCRWCDRDAEGHDTLNRFDRSARSAFRWSDGNLHTADVLSYVVAYAPASLLLVHRDDHTVTRTLVAMESLAATSLVTEAVKVGAARERPNVHFAAETGIVSDVRDPNKSFPSGHSSGAFALLFSIAGTCRMEHCAYERTIWAIGAPLSATTMWLRVAADQHYMTDVLAGAGIGASIGWWVPRLRQSWKGSPAVMPSMAAHRRGVNVSYVW